MSEVVIVIPMLPPKECSPNWRGHWTKKARAARKFRECAGYATIEAFESQDWSPLRRYHHRLGKRAAIMDVEIAWCCGRRELDDDNAWASLKAARDGIADVLFGGEDRSLVQGTLTQIRGAGTVTVTLREGA